VKATNELLKGLDRLQSYSNVLLIFTSSLVDNLNPAFKDRCCVEQLMDAPVTDCVYEILRMELNNLIQLGLLVFDSMMYEQVSSDESFSTSASVNEISTWQWAKTYWPPNAFTAASSLWEIANLAQGLSERSLKRLVTYARHKYLVEHPGDLRSMLAALDMIVREKTRETLNKDNHVRKCWSYAHRECSRRRNGVGRDPGQHS
jgi:hypothetical protein